MSRDQNGDQNWGWDEIAIVMFIVFYLLAIFVGLDWVIN